MYLDQTDINSDFSNYLPIWGKKDIISDNFSIKLEIIENNEDRSESANIFTSFNNFIKPINVFTSFFFFKYYVNYLNIIVKDCDIFNILINLNLIKN